MIMPFCSVSLVSLGSCGRVACQFLRQSFRFAFGWSKYSFNSGLLNLCTFRVSACCFESVVAAARAFLCPANTAALSSWERRQAGPALSWTWSPLGGSRLSLSLSCHERQSCSQIQAASAPSKREQDDDGPCFLATDYTIEINSLQTKLN